jgi:hypothetical protein
MDFPDARKGTKMVGWAMEEYLPPPPPTARVQAEALQAAFPAYYVSVAVYRDATRFEAVSKDGGGLWCLISTDPREIYQELKARATPR